MYVLYFSEVLDLEVDRDLEYMFVIPIGFIIEVDNAGNDNIENDNISFTIKIFKIIE